jgi:hypothetical protein
VNYRSIIYVRERESRDPRLVRSRDDRAEERTQQPGRSARFDWEDGRTRVNVTFIAKGEAKTTVAVEHRRLADSADADRAKAFWRDRLTALARANVTSMTRMTTPERPEPEAHLHTELEHELGRLARHPRAETRRLRREAMEGENPATIGIVLTGVGLWITIDVTVVVAAAFLIAYAVT